MQVLRNVVTRNGRVQVFGALQITPGVLVQSTVAGKSASDLAYTVGAKVEADARVIVANGRECLTFGIGTDKRNYEFVRHAFVVGLFHALHCVGVLPAFGFAENHRAVSLCYALPPAIAVHGVVTSADAGDFADTVFARSEEHTSELQSPM